MKRGFTIFLSIILLIIAYELYERNEQFRTLNVNIPNLKISGTFYINLARSKDRNESFLRRFNGPLPLERVEGVEVQENPKYLKKGTYGCALAHAKVMKIISQKPHGWYLVCEDDCFGDFSAIESNLIIRNIVEKTKKEYINLSKPSVHYSFNSVCSKINSKFGYSLNHVCWNMTAYLITPRKAEKSYQSIISTIDTPLADAVDSIMATKYRKPRFINSKSDNSGCNVALFEGGITNGVSSIIEEFGR